MMSVEASPEQQAQSGALGVATGSAIYVIVDVSYDYYRFQENVGAATDLNEARRAAEAYVKNTWPHNLPIVEDAQQSKSMDDSEAGHVWIERWPNSVSATNGK